MKKYYIDDTLDQKRLNTLSYLKPYLVDFPINGGTGLAFHLGHRISYDFDLFGKSPLDPMLANRLNHDLQIKSIVTDNTNEFTFYTTENIKVTFLYYPFESLQPALEIQKSIFVASLEDLIANKFYTIGRRGEIRDYVDVYYITKRFTLSYCIDLVEKKYGNLFSRKLFLGQLTFTEDLDFTDPVFTSLSISEKEFIETLKQLAVEYIG